MNDLEARLTRLEHIEAAKVVSAGYARACDAKDVDMLARDVFVDDVVLHLPNALHRGIVEVNAFYRAAFDAEPGTRRHFLTNQIAEVDARGDVDIESYFFFVSADRESVLGWGAYRDQVVFRDGQARIAEKTIVLDVRTPIDAGWAAASGANR